MKTNLVTNRGALTSQRNLKQVNSKLDKNLEKLSTGKRINHAADDAAGLSIASKLTSRVKSSRRALRNANDAASFVQVAEGALGSIHASLIRLRELSIQSASDTLSDPQRSMVNTEYQSLKSEIQRTTYATKLFNKKLLDGSLGDMKIQVGIHKGKDNEIKIDARMFSNTIHALGIFDIDASSKQRAIKSLRKIDYAIDEVSRSRAYYGSIQAVLQSTQANLDHDIENTSNANSKVQDADMAKQTAQAVKNKIISNAGVSVQVQAQESIRSNARLINNGGDM